jgi:DNA primase
MEDISVHAAALKAIEWFGLDSKAMAADSDKSEKPKEAAKSEPASPAPAPPKTPVVRQEKDTPNKPLKFRLDKLEREHPYLKERGLTLETIIDFGIGYCAKGMMADRIAIPIHNSEGGVVAYAGRCLGEPAENMPKYKLPPGFRKSQEIFNIDRATKEPDDMPLIIVEGFFDCMRLHQNGCRKVVALMGSTMSAAQEELIRRYTSPQSHVIVMLDEDEAGRAGREDIAVRLAKFVFVKVHAFDEDGRQPENLSADEVAALFI